MTPEEPATAIFAPNLEPKLIKRTLSSSLHGTPLVPEKKHAVLSKYSSTQSSQVVNSKIELRVKAKMQEKVN